MNINTKQICLAIDHAPLRWHPKLLRSNEVIEALGTTDIDALYGTYGTISRNGDFIKKQGWDFGLRVDGNETDFAGTWVKSNDWAHFYSPRDAAKLGANFVVMNLCLGVGFELQSIRSCAKAILQAHNESITSVVSCMPFNNDRNGFSVSKKPEDHLFACLQARELGADKIILYAGGNSPIIEAASSEFDFDFWTSGFSHSVDTVFHSAFAQSSSSTACVGEFLWGSDDVKASARNLRKALAC